MAAMFLPVAAGTPKPAVNRAPKGVPRKYPLETTPVGQSFFVPGRKVRSVSAYISRISAKLPGKYSARHSWGVLNDNQWQLVEAGTPNAVEGVSVWRDE
jgi:hypothetical protein